MNIKRYKVVSDRDDRWGIVEMSHPSGRPKFYGFGKNARAFESALRVAIRLNGSGLWADQLGLLRTPYRPRLGQR